MSKYDDHFHFHPTAQLVPDLILTLCQTKIAERESFYHSDFCLLESLIYLPISLSLLETGQRNSRFLFLLSKLEKGIQVSLSPLETGQENSRFLFLLSRRGKGIRISLSPLECGEIVFKFLFLFSIGLFCISSMTVTLQYSNGVGPILSSSFRVAAKLTFSDWPQAPRGPKKGQKGPFRAPYGKNGMYVCEATEISDVLAPTYLR